LRVLHLINGEYYGGSARVLTNYLEANARQAEVAVGVLFPGELERRLSAMGIATEVIGMRNRLDLAATRQVLRLARRWHADLIHTHQVRNTLLGRLASLAGGPPLVTHVHSPAFRESSDRMRNLVTGTIDRGLAWRTRRFIAVSRSLADELGRQGIPPRRIRVVANGIPLPAAADAGSRQWLREDLGIGQSDPVIGMVANLRPRKGAELLIRASAQLQSGGRPPTLVLVGEPFRDGSRDYAGELRALGDACGLGARLVMTGFRPDVERVLGGLDLFVLPSRFGEGLPMVLLEAMGAGLPVVSTPVEGITELISDGRDGLMVPVDDVGALAGAIGDLLTDPGRRARMGTDAREKVARSYSSDAMARGIEAVYREVLDDR
jgi:glycosyltransferase involved in cell wall biosynthesis